MMKVSTSSCDARKQSDPFLGGPKPVILPRETTLRRTCPQSSLSFERDFYLQGVSVDNQYVDLYFHISDKLEHHGVVPEYF